jgi:F420-0:gamma-glutamyl ligase-like protein
MSAYQNVVAASQVTRQSDMYIILGPVLLIKEDKLQELRKLPVDDINYVPLTCQLEEVGVRHGQSVHVFNQHCKLHRVFLYVSS